MLPSPDAQASGKNLPGERGDPQTMKRLLPASAGRLVAGCLSIRRARRGRTFLRVILRASLYFEWETVEDSFDG